MIRQYLHPTGTKDKNRKYQLCMVFTDAEHPISFERTNLKHIAKLCCESHVIFTPCA